MQLPFREVLHRAKQRRSESGRYDDMLPVAAAKLFGQYRGMNSKDYPQLNDQDVFPIDASLPPTELIEIVAAQILES